VHGPWVSKSNEALNSLPSEMTVVTLHDRSSFLLVTELSDHTIDSCDGIEWRKGKVGRFSVAV
jgi:hypothetical protein